MRRTVHTTLLMVALAAMLSACAVPGISPKASTATPEASPTVRVEPSATKIVLTATQTPKPTATVVAALGPVVSAQSVQFEEDDCPFDTTGLDKVRCGYVVVPEDHFEPSGPTIRLAVAIVKNTSGARRSDPVIYLAGGPGEKLMENADTMVTELLKLVGDRDLVLFDQRGAGLSEPALDCPEVDKGLFDSLDDVDPVQTDKDLFATLEACHKRLVNTGIDLSLYNTIQNAADVEAIRIALEYDKVNLLGASYGTQLAQAVMRDHPKGVRSVVLASVLPLEASFLVDTVATAWEAVTRLVDTCESDDDCSVAYPDLENVLLSVVDDLNESPVPITVTNPIDKKNYPVLLSGDDVFSNLISLLYYTEYIPLLPKAVYDVSQGDYGLMTQLMGVAIVSYSVVSRGMEFSMACADDLIGRTEQEYLDHVESLPEQLQEGEDPDTVSKYGPFAMCKMWGVKQSPAAVKKPLVSDIPTLVLEGYFDPVTPPEYGQAVADELKNSYHYEFPNAGHNAVMSVECASFLAKAFLDNPGVEPDVACAEDPEEISFSVAAEPGEIEWESYTSEQLGFETQVPKGWTEISTGTFQRASDALDQVTLGVTAGAATPEQITDSLAKQYEMGTFPESIATEFYGELFWDIYQFDLQGYSVNVAIAEDDMRSYLVLFVCTWEEADQLLEEVFVPVLEATMALY